MSTAFLTKHRAATSRSPSPLNGESAGMRILRNESSRFDPLNRPGRVGRGVLTAPRLSEASSKSGGGVRTPSPTFRFMGSPNLQQSDAHWDHEPSPTSHRFKAFMDQRKAIPGRFESLGAIPRFMESRQGFTTAQRDLEPKATASWSHSKRFAKFRDLESGATAFGVRGARSRFCRKFVGRGEKVLSPRPKERLRTLHPSPSFPLPVKGRGRLSCGCLQHHFA